MCLEENTRIFMADGSQKPIREIRIGEEVMSDSGKTQRVMNVWQGREEHMMCIELKNGSKITLTKNHPVKTVSEVKKADEINEDDEKLLSIGELSVQAGIYQCITGNTTGDIGYAQQSTIEIAGFSVVKQFVGHEIGRKLHDTLKIPAYGNKGTGTKLPENIVLAIENQVTNGTDEVYVDKRNNWTVYTADGSKSVTFEHVVVVQNKKPLVLSSKIV